MNRHFFWHVVRVAVGSLVIVTLVADWFHIMLQAIVVFALVSTLTNWSLWLQARNECAQCRHEMPWNWRLLLPFNTYYRWLRQHH